MGLLNALYELQYGFFMTSYTLLISFLDIFFRHPRKSIQGEIALVTGAGHGIGRELALGLSRCGTVLVLVDLNQENNEKVGKEIRDAGGKAFTYTCDITNRDKVFSLAEQVRKDAGDVTILWNNAGILSGARLLDLTEKAIRSTFEVNTLSHFWTVQAFLPAMLKKGEGHIIGTVSMSAFVATPLLVDYCASKTGAWGCAECLREELFNMGYPRIHVSSLCPYFVSTGLIKEFKDQLGYTLTAKETARIGIDGVLRNEELIFAPRRMWLIMKMMQVLPRKTIQFRTRRLGNEVFPQDVKED